MQEGKGKVARKSDKIAPTPPQGHSAEVTLRKMANERAHAKAKKKKGLEGYFGTGAYLPPPNLEGTPIDAVGRRRGGEDKANNRTRGEGERLLKPTADRYKAKSTKGGEGNQRGNHEKSTKKSKKSPRKSLDDEHSRQSKKTRSDDDASSPADAPGDGKTANLEAIKGSLRKKGSGTFTHKGSEKKTKKTTTFTKAINKGATEKSAPASHGAPPPVPPHTTIRQHHA